jgi:hypothetical protein
MLAMDLRTPRYTSKNALSLTTIASLLAPTVRVFARSSELAIRLRQLSAVVMLPRLL